MPGHDRFDFLLYLPRSEASIRFRSPSHLLIKGFLGFPTHEHSGTSAFNWCFSSDGTVSNIENSVGIEHLANGIITEGWCVSSDGVKRCQTNGAGANFNLGAPIYTSENKVAHRTDDGLLRVETTFGSSPFYKRIIMTRDGCAVPTGHHPARPGQDGSIRLPHQHLTHDRIGPSRSRLRAAAPVRSTPAGTGRRPRRRSTANRARPGRRNTGS